MRAHLDIKTKLLQLKTNAEWLTGLCFTARMNVKTRTDGQTATVECTLRKRRRLCERLLMADSIHVAAL